MTANAYAEASGGAWDFCCHTLPCVLPRWGTATRVALDASELGFAGIVLQSHHQSTASRAQTAHARSPSVEVLASVTLNGYTGGISPVTVREARDAGVRVIWLPTVQSALHVRRIGAGRSLDNTFDASAPAIGLSLLRRGKLSQEIREVLEEMSRVPMLLNTGHISLRELDALLPAARERGITLMINHPYFLLRPSARWWRELPSEGVYVEFAAVTKQGGLFPTLGKILELIEEVGPNRCVIGSESKNMVHPLKQCLRFCNWLERAGVPTEAVAEMLIRTPRRVTRELTLREVV